MNTGQPAYVPAIELRNIVKDYGVTRALKDVNLAVYRGEVFGYIGANGAGKTTTIKIMTGLVRPTWGDAMICGHRETRQTYRRAIQRKQTKGVLGIRALA